MSPFLGKSFIDSAEKIALKKGLEIGHEQGLEQGREEGREEGLEQGRGIVINYSSDETSIP